MKRGATYSRIKVALATNPEKTMSINILLIGIAIVALVAHALLINHLNTVNFKLTDYGRDASHLSERNGELQARISEVQTLETIEARAVELGMVAVTDYTFLTSVDTAVARR